MRKTENKTRVEGYLFSHTLEEKVTGPASKNPGTKYINGTIDIAVDDEGMNVITTSFTYVTPVYSSGKPCATFNVLKKIVDEGKTFTEYGPTGATKVAIDGSVGLNEFFAPNRETGELELASPMRNEGSFVNIVTALNPDENKRHYFKVDMVITKTTRVEANEERNTPELVRINGAVFNFRNEVMPVTFIITDTEGGMDYFEDCGASGETPLFTKVEGLINNVAQKVTIEKKSAFGGSKVEEVTRSHKEWNVNWAAEEPFEFSDDAEKTGLTPAELTKMRQDREVKLAKMKQDRIEYAQSHGTDTPAPAVTAATPTAKVSSGNFSF